jgi:hypothetical protein
MKYDITQAIPIFNQGEVLQETMKTEDGKEKKAPVPLGKFLATICVNAQANTLDAKYQIYKIASRISTAEVEHTPLELSSEDLVLIKKLVGEGPYTAIATGALVDLLEGKRNEQGTDKGSSP